MNALLAGLFVTSSLIVFAYQAVMSDQKWTGSMIGMYLYCIGTFLWALKWLELSHGPLMLISFIQFFCVLIGGLCFERSK